MKLNGLDLNKLVVFNAVAKHGGYKGASEELGLTRSAISQSITGLEEVLGKKLFNRTGARLQLTESAENLHHELAQHHRNLQLTLTAFTQKTTHVTGQLRIGAYLEFTKSKLMPVIEDFMSSYPKAQLKFIFDSPSRLKSLLENDKIDLSISIFPHNKSKSVETKKLYEEELVLIGRKDLISSQPTKEILMKTPVIDYYPKHILFKRWWHHQFSSNIKVVNIASYASTAEMVYEMVRRRLGIGVVPQYVLDAFPKDEQLHIIRPTEQRLFDHVWLSQFKQKSRSPIHAEFLSSLHRRFKS